jgi:hypothetical protein
MKTMTCSPRWRGNWCKGIGIGESADAVWKALHTEHQKLFPATSPSNEVVASLEAPGTLLTAQSDSASLVEEAIEGNSVLIFWAAAGIAIGQKAAREAGGAGAGFTVRIT